MPVARCWTGAALENASWPPIVTQRGYSVGDRRFAFPRRELGGLADVAEGQRKSVTTKDLQLGRRIDAGRDHLPAECEDRGVTVGGDVSGGAGIDAGVC